MEWEGVGFCGKAAFQHPLVASQADVFLPIFAFSATSLRHTREKLSHKYQLWMAKAWTCTTMKPKTSLLGFCELDAMEIRLLYTHLDGFLSSVFMAWHISCSFTSLEGSEDLKDVLNQEFLTWLMSIDLCRPTWVVVLPVPVVKNIPSDPIPALYKGFAPKVLDAVLIFS